jgi:hypothetical protein
MKKLMHEVFEELMTVLKGKTLDVLIPPILFAVLSGRFELITTVSVSFLASFLFMVYRMLRGANFYYALVGLGGVIIATGLALISANASSYFIPDIIGSIALIIATSISIVLKRPIAAWVSHIVRGWEKAWFFRDDVRPAYSEVSIFWGTMLSIRLTLEIILFLSGDAQTLAWANVFLGIPATVLVLVVTYIYGIWRLHTLKGPGVEEYRTNKLPPYKGQTRGF